MECGAASFESLIFAASALAAKDNFSLLLNINNYHPIGAQCPVSLQARWQGTQLYVPRQRNIFNYDHGFGFTADGIPTRWKLLGSFCSRPLNCSIPLSYRSGMIAKLLVDGCRRCEVTFKRSPERGHVAHIRGPLRRALRWLNKSNGTGRECL